jgi:CHAT domain-containing protein
MSKAIMSLAPAGGALVATGFDASRTKALSPELGKYGIVHFATHGVLNDEHRALSGIVLSLVDQAGRPQNGFLRLHDIYNLHLPAELVVLSACDTGLGKDVKGRGTGWFGPRVHVCRRRAGGREPVEGRR